MLDIDTLDNTKLLLVKQDKQVYNGQCQVATGETGQAYHGQYEVARGGIGQTYHGQGKVATGKTGQTYHGQYEVARGDRTNIPWAMLGCLG